MVQRFDAVAINGVAVDQHFQAIVLRRVVAAGDHDAGSGFKLVRSIIQHRCGYHANVDDIAAAGTQAIAQGACQLGAGQAAVPADHHRALVLCTRFGGEGPPYLGDCVGCQCSFNDAANVIRAKNVFVNSHASLFYGFVVLC